jgi:hypothetical protein
MADRERNDPALARRPSHAGRRVLVTGAGNGIGKAIAFGFAARGAAVGVCDLRPDDVAATVADIGGAAGHAVPVEADVADYEALERSVRAAEEALGGAFDTAINNAGISPKHDGRPHGIWEMDPAEWARVVAVNLTGPFNVIRLLSPAMRLAGRGWFVNVNPSNTERRDREYGRGSRADAERAIAAARRLPRPGRARPAGAPRRAQEDRRRDPRPQGRARPAALARGGQDAAEGIGEADARGQIFLFFAGEACASRARSSLRAPGVEVEITREPDRRRRPDHALELPDRHPRLEDRAGARLRQHRGVQAGRSRAGHARMRSSEIMSRARAARGRVQPRDGPRLGGRAGDLEHPRTSTPSPSPARSRPAGAWRRPASRPRR